MDAVEEDPRTHLWMMATPPGQTEYRVAPGRRSHLDLLRL